MKNTNFQIIFIVTFPRRLIDRGINRHSYQINISVSDHILSVCTEYPQEGIDAAVRDFAAVAGEANAQLLADFLAQAMLPQPKASDTAAAAGSEGLGPGDAASTEPQSENVEKTANSAPTVADAAPTSSAALGAISEGQAGSAAGSGVIAAADDVRSESAAAAAAATAAAGVVKHEKPFVRVQRNLVLQPVADKVCLSCGHMCLFRLNQQCGTHILHVDDGKRHLECHPGDLISVQSG